MLQRLKRGMKNQVEGGGNKKDNGTTMAASSYTYKLLVLGGGSGGVRASRIAAAHLKKQWIQANPGVAESQAPKFIGLVEYAPRHNNPYYTAIGGTCVNVGCVPKKLFVYGSRYPSEFEDAQGYGWRVNSMPEHDWPTLIRRKNKEIARLNRIYGNFVLRDVEVHYGEGKLLDAHTIEVTKTEFMPEVDDDGNPVMEPAFDENGSPIMEMVKDANGNEEERQAQVPVYQVELDASGNVVYLPRLDENGNPLVDADGNLVYQYILDKDGNPVLDEEGQPRRLPKYREQITKQVLSAETIMISVGGEPSKPKIPGIEHAITSNQAFYLEQRPERILMVGAGYISLEFASIFHGLGSKVVVSYRGDQLLKRFDMDIRTHLETEMRKAGIEILFHSHIRKIDKNADGTFSVDVEFEDGKTSTIETDLVFYATGRNPRTKDIGLEAAGVKTDASGYIPVDDYLKTNVDNIYACGDVIWPIPGVGKLDLTPVALHQGHCFADTMFGGMDRKPDHVNVPTAVFTSPEIGTCGYTEDDAIDPKKKITKGHVKIYMSTFTPMNYGVAGRDVKAMMKLVVDGDTDRVIGCHMLGPSAGEIVQGFAVPVKMGATKKDIDSTIGIHPTYAEEFVTLRDVKRVYQNYKLVQPGAKI